MEELESDSGSLLPGDDVSTNLQTEQPALMLFLPAYHCYAELTAEIRKPVQECGTVTLTCGEPSRLESSLPTGALLNVAGCALMQGENMGLSHDIDAL